MKIYIKTYGCTLNQADSAMLADLSRGEGMDITSDENEADVIVMNTCTVKGATQNRIVYNLKRLENEKKRIVVTGCMAGANSDIISRYAPDASIVTIQNMQEMPAAINAAANGEREVITGYKKVDRISFYKGNGSVIAKIPLSDGCLSSCSFCETKFARGQLNSFSEELILKAIGYEVARGSKEIDLTAQDTGAYGLDKGTNIAMLMEKVSHLEGSFKARVGMLNPEHLHRYMEDLIKAMQSEKFYKFMHLPVQSGSDNVLRAMRRNYTIEEFMENAKRLRDAIPELTIETDIIVGFPGETDEDFEATLKVLKELNPAVTNVSKFARRPHASASKMKQLGIETINERSAEVSRLVRNIQKENNAASIGKYAEVLFTEKTGISLNGRDPSYRQVVVPFGEGGRDIGIGEIKTVRIYNATSNALYGRVS